MSSLHLDNFYLNNAIKPIEQIKAGDLVLSWNELTEQFEYKPVLETIVGIKHNLEAV